MEYNASSMIGHKSSWERHDYSGAGNVAALLDSNINRPAVVVGSAIGCFDELEIVKTIYGPDELIIFAVNDAGIYLPRVHHWVSLHGENFTAWKAVRWLHNIDVDVHTKLHTYKEDMVDYCWDLLTPCMALSGYFAMQIAFLMGCSPIILAGCPGDATPRFFEASRSGSFAYGSGATASDKGIRQQIEQEMERIPIFKNRVRSMSGWTMRFFGAP